MSLCCSYYIQLFVCLTNLFFLQVHNAVILIILNVFYAVAHYKVAFQTHNSPSYKTECSKSMPTFLCTEERLCENGSLCGFTWPNKKYPSCVDATFKKTKKNRYQVLSSPSMMTSLVIVTWDSTRGACSSPRRVLERRGRVSVLGWTIRGSWRFLRCFCSSSALCGPKNHYIYRCLRLLINVARGWEHLAKLDNINSMSWG